MDFSTIDKNGSEQLYHQIRRIVLTAIREQDLQPGDKMLSVADISTAAGVSRMTVRQALQTLIDDGWLYTVLGKGTFVARRLQVEQNLQSLRGWTEEIRNQGYQPSTRLISIEQIPASWQVAQHLHVPLRTPLLLITRVRYASGYPLAVERTHLVEANFPGIESFIYQYESLYQILHDQFGILLIRGTQYLDAGEADVQSAALLDLHVSQPILVSERITYAATGEAVEYVVAIHRPGFIRFRTELTTDHATVREVLGASARQGIQH